MLISKQSQVKRKLTPLKNQIKQDKRKEMKENQLKPQSMGNMFNILVNKFNAIEKKFDGIDKRFDIIEQRFDQRFDGVDQRFDGVDQRLDGVNKRFDGVENKIDVVENRIVGIESRIVGVEEGLERNAKEMSNFRQEYKEDTKFVKDALNKLLDENIKTSKKFRTISNSLELNQIRQGISEEKIERIELCIQNEGLNNLNTYKIINTGVEEYDKLLTPNEKRKYVENRIKEDIKNINKLINNDETNEITHSASSLRSNSEANNSIRDNYNDKRDKI